MTVQTSVCFASSAQIGYRIDAGWASLYVFIYTGSMTMKFWETVDIADNELGFLYRRNRLNRVLRPGRHRFQRLVGRARVEVYDISEIRFRHAGAKFFLKVNADKLDAYLMKYELSDTQVGLLYTDGHLMDILEPGSFHAFWKDVENIRVELIDICENFAIDDKLIALLGRGVKVGQFKAAAQAICYAEVPDEHLGLMFVNGKLARELSSGSYGFWKYNRSVVVKLLDLRLQSADVSGQEILTRDRVSLRVNLTGSYRIVEPKMVALKLNDYAGFVYRELQFQLREAVGTRTLDQLLEDKDSLNATITSDLRQKLAEYGVELVGVGVKDIILPGEMKVILNQVVEAQKEAESNLIRRREETQAMRSLHNTAKMMENNPVLLRLKELEALERVTGRIDRISVYGGLDGLLNDLVKLGGSSKAG